VTAAAAAPAGSGRDVLSARQILEQFKKALGTSTARSMLITVAPRAGLQIMQPANVSEALIKAYAKEFHAEDRLSWTAILRGKPTKLADAWGDGQKLDFTVYAQEWVRPNELNSVVAVPLQSPVFEGYPGVVHLGRTAEEGNFTNADLAKLAEVAAGIDKRNAGAGARAGTGAGKSSKGKRGGSANGFSLMLSRPVARFIIIDQNLKPKTFAGASWSDLDDRLQTQILDHAKRRLGQVNAEPFFDRILLHDSYGDSWPYRIVTFKRYPALGDGPVTMVCLGPDCNEWAAVRPTDFQADTELARLLPAIKFMQQEFPKGPTLVDISKEVDLSPFHFHRRFTELLGLTPKQYLLDCQIFQAKTDLLGRQKELVQIAKECGFAHQSHFTSRFKQATGLTPTRWRRMAMAKMQALSN
jgi:AraC-like DNA-binding protein